MVEQNGKKKIELNSTQEKLMGGVLTMLKLGLKTLTNELKFIN
jgi:hypothetical protein